LKGSTPKTGRGLRGGKKPKGYLQSKETGLTGGSLGQGPSAVRRGKRTMPREKKKKPTAKPFIKPAHPLEGNKKKVRCFQNAKCKR